ncbi:coagulation factor VIII, partial [Cricetulus griseus]
MHILESFYSSEFPYGFFQIPLVATRRYYLGAVELYWNYRQSDMLNVLHMDTRFLPRMPTSFPFNTSIMYKKTVFVEYMDHLFNMAKPRPPWMGLLGPTIWTEVHDTVVITLKNMASHPVSLHAVGVSYWKASEGSLSKERTQMLHQFVLLFAVFDEGKSWHSETKDSFTQAMDSTSTVAWPKMHTVNGYVNRSLP